MRKKFSCYEYEVTRSIPDENPPPYPMWVYTLYGEACYPYDDGSIDSDDWFETEQEAEFAAIGHITQLENP